MRGEPARVQAAPPLFQLAVVVTSETFDDNAQRLKTGRDRRNRPLQQADKRQRVIGAGSPPQPRHDEGGQRPMEFTNGLMFSPVDSTFTGMT